MVVRVEGPDDGVLEGDDGGAAAGGLPGADPALLGPARGAVLAEPVLVHAQDPAPSTRFNEKKICNF